MEEFDRDGRVLKRAAFFAGMADRARSGFQNLNSRCEFRADSPLLISWVYFLLSDAYKPIRNLSDSLTDDYKKAALSSVAVMVIRPFVPLTPEQVDDLETYLANPIFALACANAWAADRNLFEHFPEDYLKRFYTSLLNVRMPSLNGFLDAVNSEADYREITSISLSHSELTTIDDWVLKIFMLVNQKR